MPSIRQRFQCAKSARNISGLVLRAVTAVVALAVSPLAPLQAQPTATAGYSDNSQLPSGRRRQYVLHPSVANSRLVRPVAGSASQSVGTPIPDSTVLNKRHTISAGSGSESLHIPCYS